MPPTLCLLDRLDGSLLGLVIEPRRPHSDAAEEGDWLWMSGEPKLYTNWRAGEPNNAGENEDCVVTRPDGMWND